MLKIPKISHELPINMLNRSFEINDYEYCLPHLLDQIQYMKNIFVKHENQEVTL